MKKKPTKKHTRQKFSPHKIIKLVDNVIEHRLFKPVSVVIIASFVLFYGYGYLKILFQDYKESKYNERVNNPIKINIKNDSIDFSLREPSVISHVVKSGDTLLNILIDVDADEEDIFQILSATRKKFNPRLIKEGDNVSLYFQVSLDYQKDSLNKVKDIKRQVVIKKVEISNNAEEKIVTSRNIDGTYSSNIVKIELRKQLSKYVGEIENGLFVDGVSLGASATTVMNMINQYGYDIDFQRDIRRGNKFEILVEEYYSANGSRVKDGNVIFSSITLKDRQIDMYMYEHKGEVAYYSPAGYSVKKSLLKTPIHGARVSSRYGMRRHPVLGYSRMHKGVDFAARRGTPILAAGSGVINYRGRRGGYGNYIRIKHNSQYSTAYAHASRFSNKFKKGSRVKQGDVIAYVGTTGRSTGPHLHFEVLVNGKQINPSKVKATSGSRLTGKDLAKFKLRKEEIDRYRETIPKNFT
ncbi:MAG: M23 family metallopeptidase [Rickettsiales bacterium]|nr:M23 family metallopeptidase [Rickettsiales bacterium]